MKYKIELFENWRPNKQFFTPGVYRVPEDLTEEMAVRALTSVKSSKISIKAPAPENKLLTVGQKKAGAVKPLLSLPVGRPKIKKT